MEQSAGERNEMTTGRKNKNRAIEITRSSIEPREVPLELPRKNNVEDSSSPRRPNPKHSIDKGTIFPYVRPSGKIRRDLGKKECKIGINLRTHHCLFR